jgi:hypothetical protein
VDVAWVNPDAVDKLTFRWADGATFSFDLGGQMRGGGLAGQEFFAEVKKYGTVGDQPALHDEYLAKCYRAYSEMPNRCDHFFWLTWHPFSQTKWTQLCSAPEVRRAVVTHGERALGEPDFERAQEAVDESVCEAIADRLWLIVLCDKQEELVVEDQYLGAVFNLQRDGA